MNTNAKSKIEQYLYTYRFINDILCLKINNYFTKYLDSFPLVEEKI